MSIPLPPSEPPPPAALWQSFERAAERRGPAPALDFGTTVVSFADLHALALRAAAFLNQHNVGSGDVVALQLPKRASTYALILGCLRLGAIYAPLDPKNPPARTERMLARLKPKVLLTSAAQHNPFGTTLTTRSDGTFDAAAWPATLPSVINRTRIAPTHPAYVMFTSGSTGEPKGAVIPQQGVLSLMRWSTALLGNPDQQRFTAINPLHFDNSVFDFYCGLVAGATLLPIETSEHPDPSHWAQRIASGQATVLFSVPTLLLLLDKIGALDPSRLPGLKSIVFGGEGFPVEQLRIVHARFQGRTRLINVYGPTETSCICSSLVIDEAALAETPGAYPSLGRMHPDFSCQVLDGEGRAVNPGEVGELWIGGPCVGLGYYGNPDETARRFCQDPRQSDYRAVYYRTGDLVHEDTHGKLWFHGRKDNQIKIAGHRVELEEIDCAVEALPDIRRSLTVLVNADTSPQLITAFEATTPQSLETITRALAARLPVYMRPTRLIEMPKLPVNANGKVDRLAIKALGEALAAENKIPHPITQNSQPRASEQTEPRVRAAWAAALGHGNFTATDSFFDLGGTSLALTRVHAALTAQDPDAITMIDLFAYPTVSRMAAFLNRPRDGQAAPATTDAVTVRAGRQQAVLVQLRTKATRPKA